MMKSNKELNKMIDNLLGLPQTYDVRCEMRLVYEGLPFEDAQVIYSEIPEDQKHLYNISSSKVDDYCGDLNLAMYAAKEIAGVDHLFVLSHEDSTWKASFGNWGDCAEYSGGNPAACICIALLKFMGKL